MKEKLVVGFSYLVAGLLVALGFVIPITLLASCIKFLVWMLGV